MKLFYEIDVEIDDEAVVESVVRSALCVALEYTLGVSNWTVTNTTALVEAAASFNSEMDRLEAEHETEVYG